jgi:rhamnosyltransferase subunit B
MATRFPLADPIAGDGLGPEIEEFLSEGASPVLFTAGSANSQAGQFFKTAIDACRLLGCRGVLATAFPAQLPTGLPLSVRHFAQVSFSRLFPRCRAVVHHGGIGTTAHALAAGTPQLVVPLSHDQPDNAARVRQLGVGESLAPSKLSVETLVSRLRHLTTSKDIGRGCRDIRERMRQQMPREEVVRLVEEIT